MITVYQIRGTNGSGKSTLARSFIRGNPAARPNVPGDPESPTMVDLVWYGAPTKRDPARRKSVEAYAHRGDDLSMMVIGSYRTACGGLDGIESFDRQFRAIRKAVGIMETLRERGVSGHQDAVICEGVLASTVAGSWFEFADELTRLGLSRLAFCYLDTPVEVCLERIRRRQEAAGRVREIKEDLVRDKVRAIAATREKAIKAGHIVYDLPWTNAQEALRAIIGDAPKAREFYRAR